MLHTASWHYRLPANAPHIYHRFQRRVASEYTDALEPVDDFGERTRFLATV